MRQAIVNSIRQGIRQSIRGSGNPVPTFGLPLQNSLDTNIASTRATASYTRATTATSEDHQGKQVSVLSNEPRMIGSRRVRNLITASEDMTNGAYAVTSATVDSATQVTFGGTANEEVYQSITVTDDGSGANGRYWVFSVYIRLVSGTISDNDALEIVMGGNAVGSGVSLSTSIGSSVTSTSQRFFIVGASDAAGTGLNALIRCDDAVTLEITKWQLEEVTGNITHAPSEYVSTGVGTGIDLLASAVTASDWAAIGSNTVVDNGDGSVRITYVDNSNGANLDLGAMYPAIEDTTEYVLEYRAKVDTGDSVDVSLIDETPSYSETITSTTYVTKNVPFAFAGAGSLVLRPINMGAGEWIDIEVLSLKKADHGLNRDGVKAFPYWNGNTVASTGVVTEAQGPAINSSTSQWVELDGASGTYVSMPDNAAASVTGDIEIVWRGVLSDWTPSGSQALVSKYDGNARRSYWLQINSATGHLSLNVSTDGSATTTTPSTVATGFANGTVGWIKASLDLDDGSGNRVATYSISQDATNNPDDVSWTVLDTVTTSGTVTSIDDNTSIVEIGSQVAGTQNRLDGKVMRCAIYSGIGSTTPVVDFNANDYDAGKTWTSSSTSEIWTLNGTARVFSPFAAWADLPGSSGDNISTPDSATVSVTGDLAVPMYLIADDWSFGTQSVYSKYLTTGNQRSFRFDIVGSQQVVAYISTDGTAVGTPSASSSSMASLLTDGVGLWILPIVDVSASTLTVKYSYDSPWTPYNKITWTTFEADIAFSASIAGGIYDSTAVLEVGAINGGTTQRYYGKAVRAALIASTDPTVAPVADFDARTFTPGVTTATASTGEVWTANGNVSIEQNIPSPWDASGPLGYLSEQAGTNLCLQSSDFSTTWVNGDSRFTITTNNTIAPDGSKTADHLESNNVNESSMGQSVTISSGADTTASFYVKPDSASWAILLAWDASANGVRIWYDLDNGRIGTDTTFGTGWSMDKGGIETLPNGWFRIWAAISTTGTTFAGRIEVANGDNNVLSAVGLDMWVWGAQFEAGSFPTTYTPTTTTSSTRNADVLTYSSVGNADSFPMTVSAEVTSGLDDAGRIVSVSDGSLDNRANLLISTGYAPQLFVKSATTTVASITSTTSVVPKSTVTVTGVVSANDFELYLNSASTGTPDTAGDAPSGITTIEVGNLTGGSDQLNGTIRNVKIHTKRLNDSQVATL